MIKRTLYFGNPAYLSLRMGQLVIRKPPGVDDLPLAEGEKAPILKTIPIEDIGVVILDCKQLTITEGLLEALMDNNCAVVTCDCNRMPVGLLLPLSGNTIQSERFRSQVDASLPCKKQIWQQTVQQKIKNQAVMLGVATGDRHMNMFIWADNVRSGDPDNLEARAAAYYWRNILPSHPEFIRGRDGEPPNELFNYGYAILRAIVARAIVAAGLIPTLGIHHRNRYNAYCLADDIMEPYRPYVDKLVYGIVELRGLIELTESTKVELLKIPVTEVIIDGSRRPLMIAVSATVSSLVKYYAGETKQMVYPDMADG